MRLIKMLAVAVAVAVAGALAVVAGSPAGAAVAAPAPAVAVPGAPDAARVKAAHDLLAAMQAEKMMRMTASGSKYPTEAQRKAVIAKLYAIPPEEIYTRLSLPVARLLSTETLTEMTRFYLSSYGQKVLMDTYNSRPSLYPTDPVATPKEKKELASPAYLKASGEFRQAEPAIHHETFLLLSAINR